MAPSRRKLPRARAYRTLETLVYEGVREAIVAGRYGPGQHVVASRLAIELGVSRAPVMAALKRLQSEGFVDGDPHKVIAVTTLSPSRIRELYAIRAALEALAAREAAVHMPVPDVESLAQLADDIAQSMPDRQRLRALDSCFHRRLHVASGMALLCGTLDNIYDRCEYYRAIALREIEDDEQRQSIAEHGAIIEALRRRDGETAARLMTQHIERSVGRILRGLAGLTNADDPG